jgi:uncharacterized protein (DUF342 family)
MERSRQRSLTISDVKIMLHAEGILHGIADDEQIKAFLHGDVSLGERWTIASGTDPIPDTPPQKKYHFDTDPLKIGTLTEDGLMDWKERGKLPQVKEGDLLAEKFQAPKVKRAWMYTEKKFPSQSCGSNGSNAERRPSVRGRHAGARLAYPASPNYLITGEISVMPTLHIQGDISLETGHVTFDGHIEVAGAVEKGYRVKGGSLRANEIRDAQIDIDWRYYRDKRNFWCRHRSGGNLKAGHIHNSDIILAGDMAVEKEIIESKIEANGRCLINDGIIISSTISARMGITAMDIGTEASKSSDLIVGIDRQMEREADAIKKEIQAIKAERENLPTLLVTLRKRSDQVNTQLGDVAQLAGQMHGSAPAAAGKS